MSNIFKQLDTLFPCGKDRTSGEVVGVTLRVVTNGSLRGELFWKRKAWYVNASVNAWHLHRGLCRELNEDYSSWFAGKQQLATAKRLVALAVASSYIYNYQYDDQYFTWTLDVSQAFDGEEILSLWRNGDYDPVHGDVRLYEVCLPKGGTYDAVKTGLEDQYERKFSDLEALIYAWCLGVSSLT